MGKLYNDITETIGCTPLVASIAVTKDCVASVYLKCEFFTRSAASKIASAFP